MLFLQRAWLMHPHGDLDEHPLVNAYAGAKRRIAALEQQIQNLQEAGVKRKSYVRHLPS
jgi:hypothetical protein